MSNEDINLYKELLSICGDISKYTEKAKTFPTQLSFNELNKNCFIEIYKSLKKIIPRKDLFPKIKGLKEECSLCWKFYLSPRNKSIRILDIHLGKKFQQKLIEFLKLKGFDCREGDDKKKIYPDNVIYGKNGIRAYLEIKYQSAPWIFAFKEKGRECYEGSPALDIKKLEQQFKLKENGEIKAPIYYVYWLDFPCIKGVFYVTLEDMYSFYKKEATIFNRKSREGDFKIKNGQRKKISATSKIHPSIYIFKPFSELIKEMGVDHDKD